MTTPAHPASMRLGRPRVSVVVPSYSNFTSLLRCIESIQVADTPGTDEFDVIVVTSSLPSMDHQILERRGCRIVELGRRHSTSESRNAGASHARGDLILFVDDDNVLAPDAISLLASRLERWPDAAVVGPAMYYGDAPSKLWCAGVKRSRLLMKTTFLQHLPDPLPERLGSEDFPNCFMVRRADFNAVGGFDSDRFPQQWEEGDLAKRLARCTSGHAWLVPQARVWHYIDLSLVRRLHMRDAERAYLVARGRAMFTALYGDGIQWLVYVVAAQWMFGMFYLGAALTSRHQGQRRRVVVGYLKGMAAGLVRGWSVRLDRQDLTRLDGPNLLRR